MVSKKLQDKFYAALESLKDGRNDYIVEALAAGARAAFESGMGYTGTLRADVPDEKEDAYSDEKNYMRSNWPTKDQITNADSSAGNTVSIDDVRTMVHDPDTEEDEEPVDLVDLFDDKSGKRFPTYAGQFYEKEPKPMVAEAVHKLGNTIDAMKHKGNEALVEAIQEGFRACFEATSHHPVNEGIGDFVKKAFGKKDNKEQPEQAKQTEAAKEETDEQRQGKAWANQIAKAIKETGFTVSDDWKIYNKNSKIVGGFSGPGWADVYVYWTDDLDEHRPSSLCNFTNPNFKSPDKVIALWKKDAENISNLGG